MTNKNNDTTEWSEDAIARLLDELDRDLLAQDTAADLLHAPLPWSKNNAYDWVTPNIAVGGDDYLADKAISERMRAEGVTHILDCRIEAKQDLEWFGASYRALINATKESFIYLLNGCDDDFKPKSAAYFRKSIDFGLAALKDPNAKIYVHCAAGYNRGPSSAFAIMRALGWSSTDAEKAICEARIVGLAYRQDADRAIRTLGYDRSPLRKDRSR